MSSLPESSPLILTDLPMLANSPVAAVLMDNLRGRAGKPIVPHFGWVQTFTEGFAAVLRTTAVSDFPSKMLGVSRPVKQRGWAGWFLAGVAALAAVVPAARLLSQTREPAPPELVRHAVAIEVAANNNTSGPRFMFKDERRTARSVQTKLLVETREATAGMLIAINGQPLPPEQQRAEEARLEHYVRNPEELNRKRKQEREDAERTSRIV